MNANNEREEKYLQAWLEHMKSEFQLHDAGATMTTMTDHPHNIHIPTLAGGADAGEVRDFYANCFVHQLPPDMKITEVSRTIGQTRLVDEMVLEFTHSIRMDWFLPGIPPTGKRVRVPLVVIVEFQNDKVASEHIYWDQASVFAQTGLLDGSQWPIIGDQAARKLLDTASVPSNPLANVNRDFKKDEYLPGQEFHSSPHPVYSGALGWALNKHSQHMAKVLYTAVHENRNEEGAKRGAGRAYSTWVFSEESGLKENLFSTSFELLIDSTLEPDAAIGLHPHHSTEEIYYILTGSITMTTVSPAGEEFTETLGAGDAHMVKLGQSHYGIAGPNGVRFLAIAVRRNPDAA